VLIPNLGISVSNSPGAIGSATADLAMFLMLGALRHAWLPVSSIRAGKWRGEMDIGRDPEDKVLGIIGMGSIGKSVTKKSLAFGMKVQYHNHSDHHPSSTTDIPEEVKWVSWEVLLRTSDIISVHVPLSSGTRHLLGAKEFALMKDGVTVVNTSRGPVVDELALIDALESGKLWGAGLDVFEHEPEVHPKLLKSGKVFLLPHLGAGTMETGVSS
jgi:glyoxylate reductase